MHEKEKLVVVAGYRGCIGSAYFDHYRAQNAFVMGIGRHLSDDNRLKYDLLNKNDAKESVKKIKVQDFKNVTYIHSVGLDKFEPDGNPHIDLDKDGIDDDVYNSNYVTFINFTYPLIQKCSQYGTQLKLCAIGSISDVYNVPFWQSFTKSKNLIRMHLKSKNYPFLRSVIINVSTVLDNENKVIGRPYADTTNCLKPREVVKRSIDYIDDFQSPVMRIELDIFNHDPDYTEDYFTNLPKLFEKWKYEMGYKDDEEIPHGIRI